MANDPYGFGQYFADATTPQPDPQTDWNQLQWIAAINGQTPEQYLQTQQAIQANGGVVPPTPKQQWVNNGVDLNGTGFSDALWNEEQLGQQIGQRSTAQTAATNAALGGIYDQYDPLVSQARDRANYVQGINGQLGAQSAASAAGANQALGAALGNYQTAVGNATAWDMGAFNNLVSAANAPMQMSASPWVGPASSNAADVARQAAVFSQLQGAANGSLDQTSRAAQAYANAGDIANQQRAAADLSAAGGGALNVDLSNVSELDKLRNPFSIEGMSDLLDASRGSQDVAVGQLDPEAYASAVGVRNKLHDLSDPRVTAQERLMYELSRQQQESDETGMRQALDELDARRGTYGSGSSILRSGIGAQQTSRNRMLQDMAANAQAQQRALQALQGEGSLATNMTAQANQIALQNAANRLGALGQYTGISATAANVLGQLGAANATANANRQLAAQEAAYQAYANLRAQGFSEEFARGQAADVMATANADRRLGAMNSSATLSTNMRNAGDAMNMFNQSQQQQQQQFADSFTANRQDAQFGRQVTVSDAANRVGRNYMQDQGNLFTGATGVANSQNANTQGSIGVQSGLTGQWLGAQQNADATALGALGSKAGIVQTQLGNNQAQNQTDAVLGQQAVQRQLQLRGLGQARQAAANTSSALGLSQGQTPPIVAGGDPNVTQGPNGSTIYWGNGIPFGVPPGYTYVGG